MAENESPRASGLRPPTKIPAIAGRSLNEVSESDGNARAHTSMLPPPPPMASGSMKHKPTNLPEPAPKRKTLIERAGEVSRQNAPPPSGSRPLSGAGRSTVANGARNGAAYHTGSLRSMSNASSGSSRNTSASSIFSGSVGPGVRPPSAQSSYRPYSAASRTRNGHPSVPRPPTSHDRVPDDGGLTASDAQKSTHENSRIPQYSPVLSLQKQRRRKEAASDPVYTTGTSQRSRPPSNPFRSVSITTGMQNLTLRAESAASGTEPYPNIPSYIPKPSSAMPTPAQSPCPSPVKHSFSPSKKSHETPKFLSRFTNTLSAVDPSRRLEEEMEKYTKQFFGQAEGLQQSMFKWENQQQQIESQRSMIHELESTRVHLSATNESLQTTNNSLQTRNNTLQDSNDTFQEQIDDVRSRLHSAQRDLEDSRRDHKNDVGDLERRYKNETEDLREELRRTSERSRREAEEESSRSQKAHRDELAELQQRLRAEVEEEKARSSRESEQMSQQLAAYQQNSEVTNASRARELEQLRSDIARLKAEVANERALKDNLRVKLTEAVATNTTLESTIQAIKGKVSFLESDSQAQSQEFANLKRREQEAIAACEEAQAKLRAEETLRRKLHNQVQELKGNIRVFCRVRPSLTADGDEVDAAKISFPDVESDCKEVMVLGPEQKSALGNVTTTKNAFSFDRVFGPTSQNPEVFDEISQLVQSALDGYNVCIFCYGQTGSGKTFTMSSPKDGMIPLAVQQIYATATDLEEKGWKYEMEGTFVEVYNENLNDLLGKSEDLDKKKLDIRHDNAKGKTQIVNAETMPLKSPDMLESLLVRANKNRSVAATRANERSSRSHSVFILRLTGTNSITGERSEGTLNLVDLAGSERLAHSQATGDRLKETQNINKSLSCLGDVIGALGSGKENAHIPYRNSKLTYLLQHSLGGNSKTLMFVMVSPMMAHLGESLTSLRFATKVHNTHIGTAKRQARVKD